MQKIIKIVCWEIAHMIHLRELRYFLCSLEAIVRARKDIYTVLDLQLKPSVGISWI